MYTFVVCKQEEIVQRTWQDIKHRRTSIGRSSPHTSQVNVDHTGYVNYTNFIEEVCKIAPIYLT